MKTYMGVSRDSRDNIFLTAIKYLTSLDLSQYFEIESQISELYSAVVQRSTPLYTR